MTKFDQVYPLRLTSEQYEKLKEISGLQERTVSYILRKLIDIYIKNHEIKNGE